MIRAMYFDYHGVLDRRNPSGFLKVIAAAARRPELELTTQLEPLINGYGAGEIRPNDFWQTITTKYGPAALAAGKKYILHVDPIREMWEIVNLLHDQYSLGLFSDCPADKKDVIIHAYNLPEFFDLLIFSCDARQSKIDPNFYRRMLRDGLYRPEECLLIDDNHQAVGQAAALGFATHQFVDVTTLKLYFVTNAIV